MIKAHGCLSVPSETAGKQTGYRLLCRREGWLPLPPGTAVSARGLYVLPNANNCNADLMIAVIALCLLLIS